MKIQRRNIKFNIHRVHKIYKRNINKYFTHYLFSLMMSMRSFSNGAMKSNYQSPYVEAPPLKLKFLQNTFHFPFRPRRTITANASQQITSNLLIQVP